MGYPNFPDISFYNQQLVDAYKKKHQDSDKEYTVDDTIVLRIIGDGTIHGTKVIDSKSGRMVEGINGIWFSTTVVGDGLPTCILSFQRIQIDATPIKFENKQEINKKLAHQGFTKEVEEK